MNPPAYRPGLCYVILLTSSALLRSRKVFGLHIAIMAIIMSKVHNMFYFQPASLLPECVGVFTIRSLRSHSHHAIGHAAT